MLDGRLAEAAGEEKSANPAMSSELLPESTDTKHQTHQQWSSSVENSFFKRDVLFWDVLYFFKFMRTCMQCAARVMW